MAISADPASEQRHLTNLALQRPAFYNAVMMSARLCMRKDGGVATPRPARRPSLCTDVGAFPEGVRVGIGE